MRKGRRALIGADCIHSTVQGRLFGVPKVQKHGKVMCQAAMDTNEGFEDICPAVGI